MQISINWLNDYVDIHDLAPQDIADALTDVGLEVEAITDASLVKGKVVIGEVVDAQPHPNADSLRLCKVNVGEESDLTIVCGAPNARKGIKVAVATVGSVLPGDFKIKPSKIRGERSEGMMCSERELGISDNHEQIIELPETVGIGKSVAAHYQLNDTVLTLNVTPNRSDCFGYLGVARDLAAKLKRTLKQPAIQEQAFTSAVTTASHCSIEVQEQEDCARFCALYLEGIETVPSPSWLKQRLEAAGMRPINLIVDATNYVMLEYGQPLHAYDLRHVAGGVLKVQRATSGQTLKTLDDQVRNLAESDLLICDQDGPIGLAGIMGGSNSDVKDDTQKIVVEVAHFNPVQVRKTSKRLSLHTEASHRFERGVDVSCIDQVAKRLGSLIWSCVQELNQQGANLPEVKVASDIVDYYPNPANPARIALRLDRLRAISGLSLIDTTETIQILESLSFKLLDQADGRMLFEAPSWRLDIMREIDLIEEVIRLKGFDQVPAKLPLMEIAPTPEDPFIEFLEEAKLQLAQRGLHETISFPFISETDLQHFNLSGDHPLAASVELQNPIVAEVNRLQSTALINLIKAVKGNHRHGDFGIRLFECCRAYFAPDMKNHQTSSDIWKLMTKHGRTHKPRTHEENRPVEHTVIAGVLDQPGTVKSWTNPERNADFFDLKGLIESWLKGLGVTTVTFEKPMSDELPYLHPGASALIKSHGQVIGYLGELHPRTATNFDFDLKAVPLVFEFHGESLFNQAQLKTEVVASAEKFPASTRDLAFVVSQDVTHAEVANAVSRFRKRNLKDFQLFDVFTGGNLETDKKSMAYALRFQSPKRTLNDKEVDKEFDLLLKHLQQEIGATLR